MYHSRWKGSHYNAGLHYGKLLLKNNIDLLANIPKSEERSAFSQSCVPLYKKFYPEIIEEIRGMADGLKVRFEDISDFLFSMYCFVLGNRCSCFAFSENGKTIFGRNSDFLVSIEKLYDSAFYQLDGSASFIGNTTAWSEIEDGVNEYGLAAGLTFIYPLKVQPGFNAGLLVRYILEKCKNTDEAILAVQNLPIGSQQTITLADRRGNLAIIECNCDKVLVHKPKAGENFIYTTNHFNSPEMQAYQFNDVDDAFSHERYATLKSIFHRDSKLSYEFASKLLSGEMGFMCQYDRSIGFDTVWSSIYELSDGKISRCEGNPSRKKYIQDNRLNFSC